MFLLQTNLNEKTNMKSQQNDTKQNKQREKWYNNFIFYCHNLCRNFPLSNFNIKLTISKI